MARTRGATAGKEAIPVTGVSYGGETTSVSLSTLAPLPATNLTGRKAIEIQNQDASNAIYFWITMPEAIVDESAHNRWQGALGETKLKTRYNVRWKLSGSGTNEWYAVSSAGSGTPSITQPQALYYSTIGGGTETVGTAGTAGSIAAEHGWAWGNTDTLGYNTLYVRTGGSTPAYNPAIKYDYLLSYTAIPTTSTGRKIAAGASWTAEVDGSVRIFGISATGTITVCVLEFV